MFSASKHPVPSYLAPSPFPGAPKRAIANDLSLAECVGDRPRDLRSVRPGARGSQQCSRILTTDFVHTKAVLSLYKMKSDSKCFFSALLIAQIPILDLFPVYKDNLLSIILWLKYSDTSNSKG